MEYVYMPTIERKGKVEYHTTPYGAFADEQSCIDYINQNAMHPKKWKVAKVLVSSYKKHQEI